MAIATVWRLQIGFCCKQTQKGRVCAHRALMTAIDMLRSVASWVSCPARVFDVVQSATCDLDNVEGRLTLRRLLSEETSTKSLLDSACRKGRGRAAEGSACYRVNTISVYIVKNTGTLLNTPYALKVSIIMVELAAMMVSSASKRKVADV
jgi:hypothetical protein